MTKITGEPARRIDNSPSPRLAHIRTSHDRYRWAMSDLPQLNNEPGIGASRGDMDAFAREYRPVSDQRDHREEAPREARVRKAPTLLAILISLVAGWHWFAANHYENELTRTLGDYARKNLPDASVSVDVHPLTNLVEIEVTPQRGAQRSGVRIFR